MIPLFLIHFVHKNAGRSSIVFCLRKETENISPLVQLPREAPTRFTPISTNNKSPLKGPLLYLWRWGELNPRPNQGAIVSLQCVVNPLV